MELIFATTKLRKQMTEERTMTKAYGPRRIKLLKIVLTSLRAAPNLGIFHPPNSPPHRCHELKGNLKGQISMDLDHPYRLLFEVANEPVPTREEGGLDWEKVTIIKIIGVENTHG